MKRKVIKQGHNTLTITLPAKWVEENSIKAGDELDIDETNNKFLRVFSNSLSKNTQQKSVSIDISGLDLAAARQKLRSAYKIGYDEIIVNFEKIC